MWRSFAKEDPGENEAGLAGVLHKFSRALSENGRGADALAAIQEAAELRRRLAAKDHARFKKVLARSLKVLSQCLTGIGRDKDAKDMLREQKNLLSSQYDVYL